jgi:hypothetical protein
MPSRFFSAVRLWPVAVCLAALALGCGGSDGGGRVSGKVTFKGQPVPSGKVYILPDSSQNNQGQTGFADIKDGHYDTSAEGGQGAVSGAVIIAVEGIDPNPPPGAEPDVSATVLFPRYEKKVELPAGASVQDIDVPAEAANPAQPTQQPIVIP